MPLPDPRAEGLPHTVIGGKVSSKTGEIYMQTAEFRGKTYPGYQGSNDVSFREIHWSDHGRPWDHTNPHQHVYIYDYENKQWIRTEPIPYYPSKEN